MQQPLHRPRPHPHPHPHQTMPYSFRKRSVQAAPTLRAPPKAATTRAIGVASLAAIAAGLPLVLLLLLSLSTATFTGAATAIKNNVVTRNADNARTNYYGDSGLRKQDFDAGDFGLAFVAKLDGDAINNNVTAQPLVYTPKSYGKPIVLVATEYNTIYILDAASGTILASQNYGPVGPTNVWGFPSVVAGILATPVIDADTDTVYFVSCRATGENQVKYYFYAADVMTLQVKSGFPVAFAGVPAANDAGVVFDDYYEKSRAALLMTGGMVVVCFAGYDIPPYQGWIHVIDPTTGAFKTAFSTVSSKDMGQGGGGGIWMAGYGPSTLDDGRILVATGNGIFNASAPPGDAIVVGTVLTHPTAARSSNATAELPRTYFEAVVTVQMDAETGALAPIDWYTPYNGTQMDYNDTDTAADAVVVLPEVFGSTATPRLVLAGAKQGPIKFLDLNSLGGYQQGPNGTDNIVAEINPYPYSPTGLGVWGSAGVYPLEGGYLYFALAQGNIQAWRRSANTTDGRVAFEFAGATAENFRGGVSTPIVAGTGRAGEAVIVTLDAEPLPESDMWEFVDMERITL
ncbi:hypothetical protein DFJ73DRAFT_859757 [Zopfochytrium polystomum]|nr:hypothetical protein DFJ73DRAFT_859757 [Zopfochytrium polystomum]